MSGETWSRGQTIYCQGVWRCRVEADYGASVAYIPLEGYGTGQEGQTLTASKSLFTTEPKGEQQMDRLTLTELPQGAIAITHDLTTIKVLINEMCAALRDGPKTRERSLIITNLQQARMWAEEAQATE